jgi:hypothetical protein
MTADQDQDLYPVLGVDPSASASQITHAYRALMRRHHPDTRTRPRPSRQPDPTQDTNREHDAAPSTWNVPHQQSTGRPTRRHRQHHHPLASRPGPVDAVASGLCMAGLPPPAAGKHHQAAFAQGEPRPQRRPQPVIRTGPGPQWPARPRRREAAARVTSRASARESRRAVTVIVRYKAGTNPSQGKVVKDGNPPYGTLLRRWDLQWTAESVAQPCDVAKVAASPKTTGGCLTPQNAVRSST